MFDVIGLIAIGVILFYAIDVLGGKPNGKGRK